MKSKYLARMKIVGQDYHPQLDDKESDVFKHMAHEFLTMVNDRSLDFLVKG